MRRRVVITGMGAITPVGKTVAEMFKALVEGQSGVGPTFRFNAAAFPTRFAAQVKDFNLDEHVEGADRWRDSGINSRFAAAAGAQALADSDLLNNSRIDYTRFGVYLGSGEGIQDFHSLIPCISLSYDRSRRAIESGRFNVEALRAFHPAHEAEQEMHTTSAHLAAHFGLEGPNYNCLTACAASAQAVGEATELIHTGQADLMLAGGS